jgi:hypothetical protein
MGSTTTSSGTGGGTGDGGGHAGCDGLDAGAEGGACCANLGGACTANADCCGGGRCVNKTCSLGICSGDGGAPMSTSYTFHDLGYGEATGINNAGTVVGTCGPAGGGTACFWPSPIVAAPTMLWTDPQGTKVIALNDSGVMVVQSGDGTAYRWDSTTLPASPMTTRVPLQPLAGDMYASVIAVGPTGAVVGLSSHPQGVGNLTSAVLWKDPSSPMALTPPGGSTPADLGVGAIDGLERIAGDAKGAPTLWLTPSSPKLPDLLPNPPATGPRCALFGISTSGVIVGYCTVNAPVATHHAAQWSLGGAVLDLDPTDPISGTSAVNAGGTVVGRAGPGAAVYRNGMGVPLWKLANPPPTGALGSAAAINDCGWIVGRLEGDPNGPHAHALEPIL